MFMPLLFAQYSHTPAEQLLRVVDWSERKRFGMLARKDASLVLEVATSCGLVGAQYQWHVCCWVSAV
jgi:hypothetical protein